MEFVNQVATKYLLAIDQQSFSEHDAWSVSTFERFLKNQDVQLLAAKIDQTIVGYILVFKVIDQMEILSVAVLQAYRRQKIASQLIDQLIKINPEVERIYLEVRTSNLAAIKTYQENHFKIINQRIDYYSQPTENALVMERQIG